jgi:hypothetical protein
MVFLSSDDDANRVDAAVFLVVVAPAGARGAGKKLDFREQGS